MKILLVQPFKYTGLGKTSFPPVGLGYLASAVRDKHEVRIFDCLKDADDYDDFMRVVRYYQPDLIGFNLFSVAIPAVREMSALVKREMFCITVVGGPHVSGLPESIFDYLPHIDYAIRGEGEKPFKELCDGNMKSRINEPYFSDNPEEYGMPAWDLIKPQEYFRYPNILYESVPVFFSRGCPFSCTFCAAKVTSGQRLRRRSLPHIFKELHLLQDEYGVKNFVIEDEGFGISKESIMSFCARVKEERFKGMFAMGTGMRLNIIDRELLQTMKETNFLRTIAVGIESGSQRVLDMIKKGITVKLVKEKVSLMNEMGFAPSGNFILGFPTETREEMKESIGLAFSLPIREVSFTAYQPQPGTELTDELLKTGELPADFDFSALTPDSVAYAPKGMSKEELEHIRKQAILKWHLIPRNLWWYVRSLKKLKFAIAKFITVFFRKNTK